MDSTQFEISSGHGMADEHLQGGPPDGAFAYNGAQCPAPGRFDALVGHLGGGAESRGAAGRSQIGSRQVL